MYRYTSLGIHIQALYVYIYVSFEEIINSPVSATLCRPSIDITCERGILTSHVDKNSFFLSTLFSFENARFSEYTLRLFYNMKLLASNCGLISSRRACPSILAVDCRIENLNRGPVRGNGRLC